MRQPKQIQFIRIIITAIAVLFLTAVCFIQVKAAWYNSSWIYREKIIIQHSQVNGSTALTNFPIYVNLNHLSSHFFDHVNSDGSDIRIADNGGNLMAREVAYISTTDNAGELFFVANGSLSATANSDYYLYYGNPSATEPAANGAYAKESVWKANYVAVWHFSQDPWYYGAADSTSNNYNCSYATNSAYSNKNASLVSSPVNYAVSFTQQIFNKSTFLNCGSTINDAIKSKANLTLSAWLKRTSTTSNNIAFGSSYTGGSDIIRLGIESYSVGAGNIGLGISDDDIGINSAYSSNDTNWHYASWLYDGTLSGSANRSKLYYDGMARSMSYGSTIPATTPTTFDQPFTIGLVGGLHDTLANQSLDEIRIATVTRTADWAKTEYNNLNSPSTFYSISAYETGTDVTAPSVVSVTPADNSTNVRYNTNLTIVFNDYVDTQSGNITIKRSSDNSTVQTIAANSAAVTGNGTTTLTINVNDFIGSNGYYLNIDSGAIKDLAGNSYAGIADATTWNFTTEALGNWYDDNWRYRVKITLDANQINGDLSNFPVYIKLSSFSSANLFNLSKSDGTDIRVTKIDGTTLVAREVAYYDSTNNAGELFFVANGTLSGTYNGSYYMYFGNPSATEPTANGAYAKESVWVNGYIGVWHFTTDPSVSNRDSTSSNYDCTQSGSMNSSNLVTGQVNYALYFDTASKFLNCGTAITTALRSKPKLSISSWMKRYNASSALEFGTYYDDGSDIVTSVGLRNYGSAGYIYPGVTQDGDPSSLSTDYNSYIVVTLDTDWHYMTWTYNGAQSGNDRETAKIYYDGVAQSSNYGISRIPSTSSSLYDQVFTINKSGYRGYYDELRIATTNRSAEWAITEYKNLNNPNTFTSAGTLESNDPRISSLSPVDNGTGVAVNANLVITFDKSVTAQTGNINIYLGNGGLFESIPVGSANVTGSGSATITVNPSSNFSNSTSYYVLIDTTAFDDLIGNSFAGITEFTSWNFVTVPINGLDVTSPSISHYSPPDNAHFFQTYSAISMLFSEAIQAGSGSIIIKRSSDDAILDTVHVNTTKIRGWGTNLITIKPTTAFSSNTNYYVQINPGALLDLSGNSFSGISNTSTWDFYTKSTPNTFSGSGL